ncbi:helix-turn-helix domain-containing protein [Bradyrhizobium sp. AUGA SZCCT0160]|uniref:helix-turn-helix domain-containing protein n=1 Tax=Bradyrhizobium sp. AUGA SZCCT0160 TaxID=2807662 RepID=UPI001BABDF94|nr:helix-turn-helix domain-containing protein [Bradyrhizobium sp. AUGA SZCCT0160]MBR1187305.1 helix-turn-helix domain-containing protein [Bradyrhizobium sp. AUGA SZCCT0160]
MKNDQPPAAKPLTYTVPEAGRMAGLSRNSAYAAAGRGEIPVVNFGRLKRVPAAAWDRILQEGRSPSEALPRIPPRL